MGDFLDARMQTYAQREIDKLQKPVQDKRIAYTDEYNNYGSYGAYQLQVVGETSKLKDKMFKEEGVQIEMQYQIFDIPELSQFSHQSREWITVLAKTKRE